MKFNAFRFHFVRCLVASAFLGTLANFTACSGSSAVTRYVLSTDEATIEETLAILQRRLKDVRRTKAFIEDMGGTQRMVVETAFSAMDDEEFEALMIRPGVLEFRMVDHDNETLSQKVLEPSRTPEGFKAVSRTITYERDYLKPWELDDWRAHPEVAERFSVDVHNFDRSISQSPFLEKIEQSIRESNVTSNSDLMLQKAIDPKTGELLYEPYYIEVQPRMKGSNIKDARVEVYAAEPHVLLYFTKQGRQEFGELTTKLSPGGELAPPPLNGRPIGGALAVVVDGTLITAPRIHEPIFGGTAQIAGEFSTDGAMQMARILRAGEYPAPVKIESRQTLPR